jgi:DNA-binding transcriptional ArsR family regulator
LRLKQGRDGPLTALKKTGKNSRTEFGLERRERDTGRPATPIDSLPYFDNNRIMESMNVTAESEVARFADMLAALGSEARLRIVRLLLAAHPEGLVVGEIGAELGIPPSTLSHHLDKLKNEGLVSARRESTFLRYRANTKTLQDIVGFLFAECCTRNKAIRPEEILCVCK